MQKRLHFVNILCRWRHNRMAIVFSPEVTGKIHSFLLPAGRGSRIS
jgi:hypothetical protein